VTEAGLVFIGPSPESMRMMGNKVEARRIADEAGMPIIPGCSSDLTNDEIVAFAETIGYPVMVKAAAGGGGKGMRVVRSKREIAEAQAAAAREASAAFGDARIFVEKYIDRPRHVEIQILGDAHGRVVHLGERECSIQRRHQKIIEETPSPALTPELRAAMAEAAVRLGTELGYTNAGTVEFILAPDGSFYFLEVNTRLQVEHPITEWVQRRDLVAAQLAVAAGAPLPFAQADCVPAGHAIECRVYAEDARQGFLPQTGTIVHYVPPEGPGIRVDSGVAAGSVVHVHYDPLLAKLSVWGRDRVEALARMKAALRRYVIVGVTHNIDFLHDVLAHAEFAAGNTDTHFLQRHEVRTASPPPDIALAAAALASQERPAQPAGRGAIERATPWSDAGGWRVADTGQNR